MFTSTKPLEADTSQELSWWTWNQVLWTPSELDHLVNYSDQITSSSVKLVPETIGLKDTILKVLNWLTQYWMLLEKKLKAVIAYKDSKLLTLWEVVLDLVWELFWSPKSEKNILIESWKLSLLSHPQKCQIPSLNLTMLHYLSIN